MARIDSFLKLGLAQGCSDVHLAVGVPPMIRLNGELMPIKFRDLAAREMERYVTEILTTAQAKHFNQNQDLDFSYVSEDGGRFRVNIFHKQTGVGATFRHIPTKVPSMESLNLPSVMYKFCDLHQGMVLITGSTGTGKSTTLAAMIDHLNNTRDLNIISLEDPIEFVHKRQNCLISQREIGIHTESFSDALHSALREDPDVILVGELRDLETMSVAMTAAEMGVLVLGTLHTNGAAPTIDRVINVFPADKQDHVRNMLSTSLRGVISQQLAKTKDGKGRVAVLEILVNTPAVANLIRQGKLEQLESVMQSGGAFGMRTMDGALQELLDSRAISGEEAYMQAFDMSKFEKFRDVA
jgi:twitching motility protein PilT